MHGEQTFKDRERKATQWHPAVGVKRDQVGFLHQPLFGPLFGLFEVASRQGNPASVVKKAFWCLCLPPALPPRDDGDG